MAGRRRARATSTSTVATIDENSIEYHPELSILKPRKNIVDTDSWPCFLLKDAVVYRKDGTMANMLNVNAEGPFVVYGRLDIEPDQREFMVRGQAKSVQAWIKISSSFNFSHAMKTDDQQIPIIWASGEAGWYELVPSNRYAHIFGHMVEAVSLYWAVCIQLEDEQIRLQDIEDKKPRGKRRQWRLQDVQMSVDDLLFRYAVKVGDGAIIEEVIERCKTHAAFLLTQPSLEGTVFTRWLKSVFPEIVLDLRNKEATKAPVAEAQPAAAEQSLLRTKFDSMEIVDVGSKDTDVTKSKGKSVARVSAQRSTRSSELVDAEVVDSTSDDSRPQRGRPRKTKRKSPHSSSEEAPAHADIEMRDFAHEQEPAVPQPPAGPSNPPAGSSYPSVAEPEPGLPALLSVLNEIRATAIVDCEMGKSRKHPDHFSATAWQTKTYMACRVKHYAGKLDIFLHYAADLARELGPEWQQSKLLEWCKQNTGAKPTFEHITKEEVLHLVRRQKASQTAIRDKAATEKKDKPIASPGGKKLPNVRPGGKKAGLRPSLGGSMKRLRDDYDEDEMDIDGDYPQRKTAKTSQYYADGDSDEQAEDSSGDEKLDVPRDGLSRVVIRAEKIPSTTPKGPNHTWTCEEPGCECIVRAADEEYGQERIRIHLEQHEKEASDVAKEREFLAMQESRGGHMPINFLLEKIRRATAVQRRDEESRDDGALPPQPIKRAISLI